MALDIFIPDIHGDVEALEKTLKAANLADGEGHALKFRDPDLHELVFTGDYIDRGPTNLETLELLLSIRAHFQHVILEPGNHDITALHALSHPEQPRWMQLWMDGVPVMDQVAKRYRLHLQKPTTDAHPLAHMALDPENDETKSYLATWQKFIEQHPEMQSTDFPAAYERMRELFLEGQFRILFEQMRVAHRIGGILAVHAGINEKGMALGLDRLNGLYQLAWQRRDFQFLFDYDWKNRHSLPKAPLAPVVCMMKPLPPDRTPLISEKTADAMHEEGIRVLIHGHAVLLGNGIANPGVQQCNNAFDKIADMNGDVGMSSGFLPRDPNKPSDWGFIQYDEESGQITAVNPKSGALDFGVLKNGEYVFPRKTN